MCRHEFCSHCHALCLALTRTAKTPEETNPQIKSSLRETVAVYMERAEKIKEFLIKSPDYRDPSVIPPPSSSSPSPPPSSSYGGPPSGYQMYGQPSPGGPSPYGQPSTAPNPYGPPSFGPAYGGTGIPYGVPASYLPQPMGGGGSGPPSWDPYNTGGNSMGMTQGPPPSPMQQSAYGFDENRSQSNVTITDGFDDEFECIDPANRQNSTYLAV